MKTMRKKNTKSLPPLLLPLRHLHLMLPPVMRPKKLKRIVTKKTHHLPRRRLKRNT